MALQSQLFHAVPELEAAAVSDPAHIVQGARGDHVRRIQLALIQLDGASIAPDGIYGPATAAAVAAFKRKRKILNFRGQIDDIVGKKTTAALDREMLQRESALARATPLLLLAFAFKLPPVPATTKFRIRTLLVGTKAISPFRIYQITDIEHRLTTFYFRGNGLRMLLLRTSFLTNKVIDQGAFSEFKTTLPVPVTGFQPEPCMEIITKSQIGPGRERVELSMPVFQQGGLTLSLEGLKDNNEGTFKITSTGVMLLVEPTPRQF